MRLGTLSACLALAVSISVAGSSSARAQSLSVPLRILEALSPELRGPDDPFVLRSGLERVNEPVTLGLPLPDKAAIQSAEELGLTGAEVGQFRVLDRWPSGHVRWVLVDTLASVPAGGESLAVTLTRGAGAFGGPALGREEAERIHVDTGAAQFEIPRRGFNLLDRVEVAGTEIVARGASPGVVLTGIDGRVFRSALDPNAEVVLEENGPVRAVVRARGTHLAEDGARALDFTVRMHFVKGRSRVRVVYTLRNASKREVVNAQFRSLELVLRGVSAARFTFGVGNGEATGEITPGESVDLFQGENAFPNLRTFDFEPPKYPTGISGWRLQRGDTRLAGGAREDVLELLYGELGAADGRTIRAGARFAAGWWPAGLAVTGDGEMRVGIFPRGNDRPYYTRFSSHTTREVVFDFAPAPSRDAAKRALFFEQYPLVAKARDVDWYNQSGAIWERLVSFEREAAFARSRRWPDEDTRSRRPHFEIVRHFYWGQGGGLNQYDFTKVDLHAFLRQDERFAGAYYLNARERLAYNADLAVEHSDDFDRRRLEEEVPALRGENGPLSFRDLPNAENLALEKVIFELEHRHAYGMGLYYFLSGDERFRETYVDWGEFMATRANDNDYIRGLAWNLFNVVDLYRFTQDESYATLAWSWMERFVLRAGSRERFGTDFQRGFYIDHDQAQRGVRLVQPFIIGAMVPRAYAYFHDFAARDRDQADRARDVLEGVVRFVDHELWYEYSKRPGDYGLPYIQSVDAPAPEDARTAEDWYGGLREVYPTYIYGYLLTGDLQFIERGLLLAEASARNTPGSYWFQDLPDRQTLQLLLENAEAQPKWVHLPIEARDEGNGTWTLSWTVPEGAVDLWIKHSDKTIVPWLGFDRARRTFAYDPATHVPFFAADNIRDEPAPAAPGERQTFVVRGLEPGKARSFAARVRTRAPGVPDPFPPPANPSTPTPPTDKVRGDCGCDASEAAKSGGLGMLGLLIVGFGVRSWVGSRRGACRSGSRRPPP